MRVRCPIGANASLTIKIYRISTMIRTKHHLKCCGKENSLILNSSETVKNTFLSSVTLGVRRKIEIISRF